MKIANFRTRISRKKLAESNHEVDDSKWEAMEQICETPEQYFQSAVEALDAIHRHSQIT